MKEELIKTLTVFEDAAKKATEKPLWLTEVAGILSSPTKEAIGPLVSFKNKYPELFKLGVAQAALDQGVFQKNDKLAQFVEVMCEPYRSAKLYLDEYNRDAQERMEYALGSLFQPEKYTQNLITAFQGSLIPAVESCKQNINFDGFGSALGVFTSAIDTSWLHVEPTWAVKVGNLLQVETDAFKSSSLTKLLSMEKETGKILGENATLTSIAAQIASISGAYYSFNEHWKDLIAPVSLLVDLRDIAFHQHHEIHKEGVVSAWRLSILEGSSRFVDRQVTWSGSLVSKLQKQVESKADEREKNNTEGLSALPLIPQYIGYTKRENETTSPEQGLEKSPIIEITEKGKKIVENIVIINELCARTGKKQLFKYTGKMMIASLNLGRIFCSSDDNFGIMIDNFYTVFYENLEHIKELVTDHSVRNEDIYQCIFRVKDMRTDIRHDFEHGDNINKKRKEISECYIHYVGNPILIHQKDYVALQNRMYDEFLLLEDHIIKKLCMNEETDTQ